MFGKIFCRKNACDVIRSVRSYPAEYYFAAEQASDVIGPWCLCIGPCVCVALLNLNWIGVCGCDCVCWLCVYCRIYLTHDNMLSNSTYLSGVRFGQASSFLAWAIFCTEISTPTYLTLPYKVRDFEATWPLGPGHIELSACCSTSSSVGQTAGR